MKAVDQMTETLASIGEPVQVTLLRDVTAALAGEPVDRVSAAEAMRKAQGGLSPVVGLGGTRVKGWLAHRDFPDWKNVLGTRTPRLSMLRILALLVDRECAPELVDRLARGVPGATKWGEPTSPARVLEALTAELSLLERDDENERRRAAEGDA